MRTYADVISLWETAEQFSADVGVPGVTGRAWKNRNSIPDERWLDVVSAAARRGFEGVTLELLARISKAGGELPSSEAA